MDGSHDVVWVGVGLGWFRDIEVRVEYDKIMLRIMIGGDEEDVLSDIDSM